MSRFAVFNLVLSALVLTGCAAADPTGGAFGKPANEYVGGTSEARQFRCPAGETLICETKSPNRVSDGRYGFRGNRKQERCGCQPDRYLHNMTGNPLPSPREL